MATGIFIFVEAEVSMSSGLLIYLQDSFDLDITKPGLLDPLFFFAALMTGLFLEAISLNWIKARTFLAISFIKSKETY